MHNALIIFKSFCLCTIVITCHIGRWRHPHHCGQQLLFWNARLSQKQQLFVIWRTRKSSGTECSICQCLRTWPYKFQWGWRHKLLTVLCDAAYYNPLLYFDLRSCFQYCHFPCKFYGKIFSIHLINDIYSFVKNEKNYNGWNSTLTSTFLE